MDDSSALMVLRDFAKRTNRNIEFDESRYPLSSYRKIERFRTFAYIPNNEQESCYFVWLSDPYRVIGEYSVFCGVFIPIASKYKERFYIRKKNILDNLNLLSLIKNIGRKKPGFLSSVVISGNDNNTANELFSGTMAGHKILEALELSPAMRLSVNIPDVDFVPGLKDKSYIAIMNPQEWFLDKGVIEKMFRLGEEIGKHLK
ncbi:MAG: hypothetical protein CVU13_07340 [Bacteroidetes bacterium HGW-Bacteroidetes-8]|jgi:hypothetical protein|nr:MAG: hypothetical protein CVU13_07340 [Bacteroidetes bacterium HGW-Bacteroidetes-8]